MPALFNGSVIRERWHRRSIDPGRKRTENILHIIRIPTAASEVPTLMPVGWLNRKAPVILEIKSIPIASPCDPMALNALLIDDELSALLKTLLARCDGFNSVKLKDRLGFGFLIVKLSIFNELAGHKGEHLQTLFISE